MTPAASANVILISATVPVRVTTFVLFPPMSAVARPPAMSAVTVSVPSPVGTDKVTTISPPPVSAASTSTTLTPAIGYEAFVAPIKSPSSKVCAPGTVTIGSSFTASTLIATVSVSSKKPGGFGSLPVLPWSFTLAVRITSPELFNSLKSLFGTVYVTPPVPAASANVVLISAAVPVNVTVPLLFPLISAVATPPTRSAVTCNVP